ncbi:saccharopine dehydrogenase family protein [bacterium]
MRYIVPGGAGDMGSRAVEDLAASQGVAAVTIADRNFAAARRLADTLKGGPATVDVVEIDAEDFGGLVDAFRGYDVVASTLGPFYKYEEKLVSAAIEAGVNYCSICDEWDAAEAVMEKLGKKAREKGVTAVIGLGTSPGITNVAVRHLADQMDTASRAEIYIHLPMNMGGGTAVIAHGVHIMTGDTVVWRNGKRTEVEACSEKKTVELPVFGKMPVWNMGHTEPVTIPQFLPGIRDVEFYMGFGKMTPLLIGAAKLGLGNSDKRVDAIYKLVHFVEKLAGGEEPGEGALRIDVWGEKDGGKVHLTCFGTGTMRDATALSLSVGARVLGEKKLLVDGGGIYAPEAVYESAGFFNRMKSRGMHMFEDIEMSRPVA